MISFRTLETGRDFIDAQAQKNGVTRTEQILAMLAIASQHGPAVAARVKRDKR